MLKENTSRKIEDKKWYCPKWFFVFWLYEDGERELKKEESGSEEFKYLGLKIDKEYKQENYIKNRINKCIAVTAMLNSILWNRNTTRKKYKYIIQY